MNTSPFLVTDKKLNKITEQCQPTGLPPRVIAWGGGRIASTPFLRGSRVVGGREKAVEWSGMVT